jgi:hypothetical protein
MFEGGDARTGGDQTVLNFNSAGRADSVRSLKSSRTRSEAYPLVSLRSAGELTVCRLPSVQPPLST